MLISSVVLLAGLANGTVELTSAGVDSAPVSYREQIETSRRERLERLKGPTGWLSLIGLHWLKPGDNSIGHDKKNNLVLNAGPAKLGHINVEKDKISLHLEPGAAATVDGVAQENAELLDDTHEKPTTVAFGTASFYVIDRSGKKGLRVKDSEAETRKKFLGIDYFDIQPGWRIEARWEPFDPPHTMEVPTIIGTVEKYPVPGKAVFERDGKTFELLPVIEAPGDTELFIIMADRTSGKETYGAARFLYAPMPKDGKIVLDFNKAYNPPCAFTPYATCPLAPPENRLDLRVDAGEKKYRGAHH